jgi:hypothetical protein
VDPMRVPHPSLARSLCPDLWPQMVSPRRQAREDWGLLLNPPEGCGALGDQVAPSQNSNTLDHLTHSRL